jgi:hypothetical protein
MLGVEEQIADGGVVETVPKGRMIYTPPVEGADQVLLNHLRHASPALGEQEIAHEQQLPSNLS